MLDTPFLTDKNLGFPRKPRIAPDLRIFNMPDGLGVQIRGGITNTVLRGQHITTVWPWLTKLLDGTRTIEELLSAKPAGIDDADVLNTLWVVFCKGLIIEGDLTAEEKLRSTEPLLNRQNLFWGRKLGITRANRYPEEVQQTLSRSNIALFGNGLLGRVTFDLLQRSGIGNIFVADWEDAGDWTEPPTPAPTAFTSTHCSLDAVHRWLQSLSPFPDLLVTATRDVPVALFNLINRHCIDNKIRWLRGHDDLVQIEIGPFVDPLSSGCYTCMRLRQISCLDHPVEEELYHHQLAEDPEQMPGGTGESLTFSTAGAGLIATEAFKILTGIAHPSSENAVITMSFAGSITTNRFLKVPRCPDCYKGGHAAGEVEHAD